MKLHPSFAVLAGLVVLYSAGPLLAPHDPLAQQRDIASAAPSIAHWLGTDDYGRDVLSRFLAGGSWSILTGATATAAVLLIGWVAGGIAGLRRRWLDGLIMRLCELMLSIPWLYALIGLRAILPLNLRPRVASAWMLLLIALVSWARPARLVRGLVVSLSEKGYVQAARGFGRGEWYLLWRHILPGTYALLAAQALVIFPRFVLAEVTLSFLGLGAGEPDPSWGALILGLKQAYLIPQQWWRVLPVCLMLPLFGACAVAARVAAERFRAAR